MKAIQELVTVTVGTWKYPVVFSFIFSFPYRLIGQGIWTGSYTFHNQFFFTLMHIMLLLLAIISFNVNANAICYY